MLSKAEIQDYTARLHRLGITDEAQVKAVLDYIYSIAVIAVQAYYENKEKYVGQNDTSGQEDSRNMDPSQYQGTSR